MLILALDSSASPASAALLEDGRILSEFYMNTKQTHSQTLMPMVESVLRLAERTLSDVDRIAVSAGPGSFTGVRIGVSCVKGMAMARNIPCAGVSTLRAMAENARGMEGIVCAVMDARCGQVYNAIFRSEGGIITRQCADRAVRLEELAQELSGMSGRIILAGDGAELAHKSTGEKYELAPYILRYQRGSGVCYAAQGKELIDPAALMPSYLRLPQAERERLAREGKPVTE